MQLASIYPCWLQLYECISATLLMDDSVQVRKAAAMFIYHLLIGLGKDCFKVRN